MDTTKLVICLCLLAVVAMGDNSLKMAGKYEAKKSKEMSVNEVQKSDVKHRDCHEWRLAGAKKSGVYVIHPNGTYPTKVHCEHGVNASFTVIQRRIDGRINFYTTWYYYKLGFGSAQGDYWAGLDTINHLTTSGNNRLQIDLQDWSGNRRQATYAHFLVLDERNYYQLSISGFAGNVLDDMAHHNGMRFSTPDRPDPANCAVNQRAGWWFNYCAYTLPNGIYYSGGPYSPTTGYYDGIYWKDWMGFGYSLKFISMSLSR